MFRARDSVPRPAADFEATLGRQRPPLLSARSASAPPGAVSDVVRRPSGRCTTDTVRQVPLLNYEDTDHLRY